MSTRSAVDLFVVVGWTIAAVVAALSGVGGWLRAALALPLVVLFPGYALLAVLFPAAPGDQRARRSGPEARATFTDLERLAFSVAASVALVPAVAFVLSYTRFGVRLRPVALAVGGLTVALSVLAFLARLSVPAERRAGLPRDLGLGYLPAYLSGRREGLGSSAPFEPTSGTHRLLNVVFVVAIVVFAASVGYAAVAPSGDDRTFTEFYLLTEQDDGQLRAENFSRQFSAGESRSIYVAIGNHEREDVQYTVVVQLEGETIQQFQTEVAAGNTKRIERNITPEQTGDNLTLSFQLYRGDPGGEPYREVHLQVTVG